MYDGVSSPRGYCRSDFYDELENRNSSDSLNETVNFVLWYMTRQNV